jgi:hypothetical protein
MADASAAVPNSVGDDDDAVVVDVPPPAAEEDHVATEIDGNDDVKLLSELQNKPINVSVYKFRGEYSCLYGLIFLHFNNPESVGNSSLAN